MLEMLRDLVAHKGHANAAVLDAIARQVRSGSTLTGAIVEEVGGCTPFDGMLDQLAAGLERKLREVGI